MDVNFTLLSLHDVLEKIPIDYPAASASVDLDFSEISAPFYIKHNFQASIDYQDRLAYEACCSIYFPGDKNITRVVFIMKQEYEDAFKAWLSGNKRVLKQCCLRREIYCHEVCHLVAIIRAFPSDKSSLAKEDFIRKSQEKFDKSMENAADKKVVSLDTKEKSGKSPSVFDKEHFRYGDDNLNYFELYKELMLPYDRMVKAIEPLRKKHKKTNIITIDDMVEETLVSKDFFSIFPEKLAAFQQLLAENLFK